MLRILKKVDLSYLLGQTRRLVYGRPVEVATCLVAYALYLIDSSSLNDNICLLPLVFGVVYAVNNYTSRARRGARAVYYASAVLIAVAMLPDKDLFMTSRYIFGLLLAVMAMLFSEKGTDDDAVANNFFALAVSLVRSVVVGAALSVAVALIYFSVCYIFGLKYSDSPLLDTVFFVWAVVVPCAFLVSRSALGDYRFSATRFLDVLANYIVGSAVIVYTAILYLYLAEICVTVSLPVGGLASMIASFYIVAFVWMMMHRKVDNRYYRWFYRRFGYISLPLLALFAVGLLHRVCQYGFTEDRAYMCYAGVTMLVGSAVLIFARQRRFAVVLYVAAALIALSTYVPYVNARQIGVRSQRARLESLAREVGALDEATGKVTWKDNASADEAKTYAEMESAYQYLVYATTAEDVEKRYGAKAGTDYKTKRSCWHECTYEVDVRDYTTLVPGDRYKAESDSGRVKVYVDSTLVMDEAIRIPDHNDEDRLPLRSFVYTNDTYMLVLHQLHCYGDEVYLSDYTLMRKARP